MSDELKLIDPLLQGEISVKGYSDNLFSTSSSDNTKEDEIKDSDTNAKGQEQPKQETEEPKKETSEIGKDYDGDDVQGMFDNIDKEKPLSDTSDEEVPGSKSETDTPKSDVKIPKEHADAFAGMVSFAVKTFIPPAFVFLSNTISGVKEVKIYENVFLTKKLPEEFYKTYTEDQESLRKTLTISDEEIEMIKGSFSRFAQYKQIKAVNPQTEFFTSITLVFGNLVMKSIEEGAKASARWNKVFEKFGITD